MGPEHKSNRHHLVTETKKVCIAIIALLRKQSLNEELVLQMLEASKDLCVEQTWLNIRIPDVEKAEQEERW